MKKISYEKIVGTIMIEYTRKVFVCRDNLKFHVGNIDEIEDVENALMNIFSDFDKEISILRKHKIISKNQYYDISEMFYCVCEDIVMDLRDIFSSFGKVCEL